MNALFRRIERAEDRDADARSERLRDFLREPAALPALPLLFELELAADLPAEARLSDAWWAEPVLFRAGFEPEANDTGTATDDVRAAASRARQDVCFRPKKNLSRMKTALPLL